MLPREPDLSAFRYVEYETSAGLQPPRTGFAILHKEHRLWKMYSISHPVSRCSR